MSNNNEGKEARADGPTPRAPDPEDQKRSTDQDRADVRSFLEGDVRAFERLMVKYQDKVFNLAYRFLNSREEAEELSQEIFLKVYRQLKSFRGDALFSTWLFQVASNHCKNRLKYLQRRRRHLHESLDAPIETRDGQMERAIPDESLVPETLVGRMQIKRLVTEKIATLPEDYRIVLILRDIQGLSYQEISESTGTAEGTVKSRLHRARMELRKRLKPFFDPSMIE